MNRQRGVHIWSLSKREDMSLPLVLTKAKSRRNVGLKNNIHSDLQSTASAGKIHITIWEPLFDTKPPHWQALHSSRGGSISYQARRLDVGLFALLISTLKLKNEGSGCRGANVFAVARGAPEKTGKRDGVSARRHKSVCVYAHRCSLGSQPRGAFVRTSANRCI